MSYILEALKKSDAERKRGEVPTLSDTQQAPTASIQATPQPMALIVIGAVVVLAIGSVGTWLMMGSDEAPQPAEQVAQQVVEPQPAPVPEEPSPEPKPVQEPEPTPTPEPAPEPEPEPVAQEPEPELVLAPQPEPQEVAVLTAKPAPAPKVEAAMRPIPEPKAFEPEPENTLTAKKAPELGAVLKPKPVTKIKEQPRTTTKTATKPRLMAALKSTGAYVDRAWTSMDKGLYAQAIQDLDRAIAQEPAFADAWFARGWALEKSGDEAAAIVDYGRAIDAKPGHAFALFSRGFLNLYGGSARDAVVDFVRTLGVAEDNSLRLYSHLWLYLSRTRAGQNAQARLKDDAASENLSQWPGPLIKHLLGTMSEAKVQREIEQGPKSSLKERRATGYFFLGVTAQMAGHKDNARAYFEKTLATGAVDFRQYDAAKRELNNLQ